MKVNRLDKKIILFFLKQFQTLKALITRGVRRERVQELLKLTFPSKNQSKFNNSFIPSFCSMQVIKACSDFFKGNCCCTLCERNVKLATLLMYSISKAKKKWYFCKIFQRYSKKECLVFIKK